jgi:hypothetical protein
LPFGIQEEYAGYDGGVDGVHVQAGEAYQETGALPPVTEFLGTEGEEEEEEEEERGEKRGRMAG